MPRRVATLVALLAAAVAAASAQKPAFRAEIDYVEFPVRVLDSQGNVVRDLKQSDVQLFEDGKPQTIETFRIVEVNASETARDPSPQTAVVTNAAELAHVAGQIYLIVFDDYHILPDEEPQAKNIAARFIRTRLTADDVAAVAIASGGGQDFTSSREALLSAVDGWHGRNQPVQPVGAEDPNLRGSMRGMMQQASLTERQINARAVLKAITDSSTWLGDARGRHKILLLISDEVGCVAVADRAAPCGFALSDAVKSAQRADVSIYPVHAAGLDVPDCATAHYAGGLPGDCASAVSRARGPRSALSVLATETGGFMIKDTNNFDGAFDRVLSENSAYYVVGYYSTNENHNGKFRKNEIRLTQKELRALCRSGYLAPSVH